MTFLNDVTIASLPAPAFLVDGVLPEGLTELHGQPGSRKSFLAIDVAMSIAAGLCWSGREVKRGEVIYVLGEGAKGTGKRVQSWKLTHGIPQDQVAGVYFHNEAVQFLNRQQMEDFSRKIEGAGVSPVLVVFDTFSRCFEGADENSAEAVSKAVGALQRFMTRHSTSVLIIHHMNKGGKTERGSTAIRGAVDGMLSLRTESKSSVVLEAVKLKDGVEFDPMRFSVRDVGDSCVLVPDGHAEGQPAMRTHISGAHLAALAHLADGPLLFEGWWALVEQCGGTRSTFKNHRKQLLDAGLVLTTEDGYGLTEDGRSALRRRAKGNRPYSSGPGPRSSDDDLADAA